LQLPLSHQSKRFSIELNRDLHYFQHFMEAMGDATRCQVKQGILVTAASVAMNQSLSSMKR
jgi:hypothetical protein